jgi:hypothetical protein
MVSEVGESPYQHSLVISRQVFTVSDVVSQLFEAEMIRKKNIPTHSVLYSFYLNVLGHEIRQL